MDKLFTMIVCYNASLAIGNEGDLLYDIQEDKKRFKDKTSGSIVIMGRKTFESLPGKKPLPGRVNIVLTRDEDYHSEYEGHGLIIMHDIYDVVSYCKENVRRAFVIGGSQIYEQFLGVEYTGEIDVTYVYDDVRGDTWFPDINIIGGWEKLYECGKYTGVNRIDGREVSYKRIVYVRQDEK